MSNIDSSGENQLNGKPPGKKPLEPARVEQLTAQLKTAVQKRRPWRLAIALLLVVLFGLPIGLAVWFFWPKGPGPNLELVAFDQLWLSDQSPKIRAQLSVVGAQSAGVSFPDYEIYIQQEGPGLAPGEGHSERVKPDVQGAVVQVWDRVLADGLASFKVRYRDPERNIGREDMARIWIKPSAKKLLLVDPTALVSKAADLRKLDTIRDISGLPAAKEALQKAQQAGYFVAYLTGSGETPIRYFKLRDWLGREGFPEGPLLFQSGAGTSPAEVAAWQKLVREYKGYYPLVQVVVRQGAEERIPQIEEGATLISEPERDWENLGQRWHQER